VPLPGKSGLTKPTFHFHNALKLLQSRNIFYNMTYLKFKKEFFELACFSLQQVYAWQPGFDRNNLTRWIEKGYIFRLKQGYFAFSEYLSKPDYAFYFANKMYSPSYISLQSALAFYGMIPESVVQITSVTSRKTANFTNQMGEFSYKTIKLDLMFGYNLKSIPGGKTMKLATPEKAILDLLYLYPFYNSEQDFLDLRIDEDFLLSEFNSKLLEDFCQTVNKKALNERVDKFLKTYKL
jgi:predicted transcriptional regulator of viral defense system